MKRRPSQLRRLAPCVVLAVAAHAAVLALPARPGSARGEAAPVAVLRVLTVPPTQRVSASPPVGQVAATLQRSVPKVSPRSVPEPERAVGPEEDAQTLEAQSGDASMVDASTVDQPTLSMPTARSEHEGGFAPQASSALPLPAAWALPGAANEDDAYLARSLLTLAPQPLSPVLIPAPDFVNPGERYQGELTLFIDETGAVVRVRAETDGLPAPLEDAARRAFMAARFAPGELADLGAVKSRIRVEVVFEGGSPLS